MCLDPRFSARGERVVLKGGVAWLIAASDIETIGELRATAIGADEGRLITIEDELGCWNAALMISLEFGLGPDGKEGARAEWGDFDECAATAEDDGFLDLDGVVDIHVRRQAKEDVVEE